jgi:hypothetical protein
VTWSIELMAMDQHVHQWQFNGEDELMIGFEAAYRNATLDCPFGPLAWAKNQIGSLEEI